MEIKREAADGEMEVKIFNGIKKPNTAFVYINFSTLLTIHHFQNVRLQIQMNAALITVAASITAKTHSVRMSAAVATVIRCTKTATIAPRPNANMK